MKSSAVRKALDLPDDTELSNPRLEDANDWVEREFRRASVPLPTDPATLEGRAVVRAVAAYYAHLAAFRAGQASRQDGERVQKLKDGDTEITFAALDASAVAQGVTDWLAVAWQYLLDAGLPDQSISFPGASR